MCFRKPETIPLLFIITAVTVLLSLGMWQVERLQWKEAMIVAAQKAQAQPALGTLPQDVSGIDYRNVALIGTFMYDKSLHMVASPQGGVQGFFIVTPFKLDDDGRIILVNRGFSPEGKESKLDGMQAVKGVIRPARAKRHFSPDNRPDKNVWFYEDIAGMSKATGLQLTPVVVEEVGVPQANTYPVPNDGKIRLRNDHLQYAVTWFALAAIAVVMFGLYYRVPKNKAGA
jgi:surfeit locus 1 family protein